MTDQVVTLRIRADGTAAVTGINKVERELGGVGRAGESSGRKAGKGLREVETNADRAGQSINKAKSYLVGFLGAATLVTSARGLGRMADEYQNIGARLQIASANSVSFAQSQQDVLQVSLRTHSALATTADLVTKLSTSFRSLGADSLTAYRGSVALSETVLKAVQLSGASASAADAAIVQLGQGLASGTLRGDELNSVLEQTPRLAQAIAEGMGKTVGQLRALGAQGKITAQQIVEALHTQQAQIEKEYQQLPLTIGRAWTDLQTKVMSYVGTADQANGASNKVARGIKAIADHIDDIANATVLLGKIVAAVYVGKLLKNGAAWIASLQVQTAETVALGEASAAASAKNVSGIRASIKQLGLLKVAGSLALSAFAGWSIGSYLRDQFVEARIAGLAFVGALLEGWENVKFTFRAGLETVIFAFKRSAEVVLRFISNKLADMAVDAASIPGVGDDLSGKLLAMAKAMQPAISASADYKIALEGLRAEHAKNVGAIQDNITGLVTYERKQDEAKNKTAGTSHAAKDQDAKLKALIEQLKKGAKATEALGKAQANAGKKMSDYEKLMARVAERTQGYQDTIDGLSKPDVQFRDDLSELSAQLAGGEIDFSQWTDGVKAITDELHKAAEAGKGFSKSFDDTDAKQLQQTTSQMVGAVAGASAYALRGIQTLTKEGSKEYEALNIAASALAGVQAVSAIVNQGSSGDPYSAFGRMAAMAGALAPLLASIGQSISSVRNSGFTDTAKQRQETQGTGSVLGDAEAKSESIERATKITADATKKLVAINTGMLRALQSLQASIGSASGMLARGAGEVSINPMDYSIEGSQDQMIDAIGGFFSGGISLLFGGDNWLNKLGEKIWGGKTKVTDQGIKIMGGLITDLINNIAIGAYQEIQSKSWAFGSTHTSEATAPVSDEFAKQFQLIIRSIVDTVREGAKALGISADEIEARINAYRVAEQHISLKGLSAEEQQAELEAVFSKIFDGLAGAVVPYIEQFQQVGEGLGETLVRVATEVQVTQEAVRQLGFALDTTDPEKFAQAADGLVQVAGGIENLISGMQSFVDAFAPDEVKQKLAHDALTSALEQVGLQLPDTAEGMWELMQSLDASTEAGREQIATLLRLTSTASQYYDMIDSGSQSAEKSAEEVAAALQKVIDAQNDYANTVLGLQNELGQNSLGGKLLEIAQWSAQTTQRLNELAVAAGRSGAAEKDLALVHQVAAARASAAIAALMESSANLVQQLYGGGDDATSALNSFGSAVSDFAQKAKDATDLLLGDLSPYTDRQKLQIALEGQRAGTVSPDQVLQIGRRLMASGADYRQLFDQVMAIGDRTQAAKDSANIGRTASATTDLAHKTLSKAQRYQLADQLANNIADLAAAQDISFQDVADKLGLNLADLGKDLGLDNKALTNYLDVLASDNFGLSDLTGVIAAQVDRLISAITGHPVSVTNIYPLPDDGTGSTSGTATLAPLAPVSLSAPKAQPADPALLTQVQQLNASNQQLSDRLDAQAKAVSALLAEIRDHTKDTADATSESVRLERDAQNNPSQPRRTQGVPVL